MRSADARGAGAPSRVSQAAHKVLTSSLLRFFVASLFGLVLDVCTAWTLTTVAGLPLIGSVAISIGLASVVMYFVHEFWTFGGRGQASASRLIGTVGSAVVALGVRSACLVASSTWIGLGERWTLLQITAATGLSFVTNYLLVRRLLGGTAPPPPMQDAPFPPRPRIPS